MSFMGSPVVRSFTALREDAGWVSSAAEGAGAGRDAAAEGAGAGRDVLTAKEADSEACVVERPMLSEELEEV
jgi:hypothetical protein